MRIPYFLHSSLIHLVTFVSVFGTQVQLIPSTTPASTSAASAAPSRADNTNASQRVLMPLAAASEFVPSLATLPVRKSPVLATSISTASAMFSASYLDVDASSQFNESRTTSLSSEASSVLTARREDRKSTPSTYTAALKVTRSTSHAPLHVTPVKLAWKNSAREAGSALAMLSSTMATGSRQRVFRNKHHHDHHWGPFFEEPQLNSSTAGDNANIQTHLYTEAVLNCRVGMLKDKTVMWVRRTDEKVSLLTVGNVTYSGDPRIRVKFQYPNNWRLLINPTQREDAGIYMCQVSTHPPRVFTTNLTILEAPLRVIDEQARELGDRYYKSGSTIDLQCQVSRSFVLKERQSILGSVHQNQSKQNQLKANTPSPLGAAFNELVMKTNQSAAHKQRNDWGAATTQALEKQFAGLIYWAKDDEPLPATTIRRASATEKWLNSRISIPDAKLADSGNYSCSIGRLFTAIVQVQILTGELPAAVQHNSAIMRQRSHVLLIIDCLSLILATAMAGRRHAVAPKPGHIH